MSVFRLFVGRREGFGLEAATVVDDISEALGIDLGGVEIFQRYDVEGVPPERWELVKNSVLSEPQTDMCRDGLPQSDGTCFAIEPLPGQFDQRADSAAQCIQMLLGGERPTVRTAKVYIIQSPLDDKRLEQVKSYLLNAVECRWASMDMPSTLAVDYPEPADIKVLDGFIELDDAGLHNLISEYGLAMDTADLEFLRDHFRAERRDPTLTELRVVDTYWSDHCRHTTFGTVIDHADIDDPRVAAAFDAYRKARPDRPVTLMNIATASLSALKKQGRLANLDESEEINACSIKVTIEVDGKPEQWVLMFKNETHNHPTEIEPFGGAATCLGGAIRDPLSGRSYVYHAMRVTGAGDPLQRNTLQGKLPQRKLTRTAAAGYSSYGNQIGLATGLVDELYHPGYVAKRMEIGAVVGAAPMSNIRRERPLAGDIVVLVGGRTGRDGIGGATGSSKAHDGSSLAECAAEVQKGNPPEERKLQRLFRKPEVSRLIKRCNDFGAGGVAVAIGELADGLDINLDRVPKKYDGLDGTEIAISESQERMAVVVSAGDAASFIAHAAAENLEATAVAEVTDSGRLRMSWRGKTIVDLTRKFLDTNGAEKHATVLVAKPSAKPKDIPQNLIDLIRDLRFASRRGLVERFDGSIGAASVLMPFGGRRQRTPAQSMAALFPTDGNTNAVSVMSYDFDPYLTESDPFGGSVAAVVGSVSKLVAAGCDHGDAYLTLQEYFERLRTEPSRWGKPFAALLGAFSAQMGLGVAAIGGKDSMSGSFGELDVPPTLVSFAIAPSKAEHVVTPEFKRAGERVYLIGGGELCDYPEHIAAWQRVRSLVLSSNVSAAWAVGTGVVAEGVAKMTFGNGIGFKGNENFTNWFGRMPGAIMVATTENLPDTLIGVTTDDGCITLGDDTVTVDALLAAWEAPLEPIFPTRTGAGGRQVAPAAAVGAPTVRMNAVAQPIAVIPVFPGTNCELDTARAVRRAGGRAETIQILNLTPTALRESIDALQSAINRAQMVILPGGFSGGDEPDGSAKFITALFRNPAIADSVQRLLRVRDGLMLGICNGFQALVKLGLLPFGEIRPMDADCPTLTHNTIGRHQSRYVVTRTATTASPWLADMGVGDLHAIPVSHGEGRFVATPQLLDGLFAAGQVAFQYCDLDGNPSMDSEWNPNGSAGAIEGIISADGRILGKMGHSERVGSFVAKNIDLPKFQPIFECGVKYYG